MTTARHIAAGFVVGAFLVESAGAQQPPSQNVQREPAVLAPDIAPLLADRGSELRGVVERYTADRQVLLRRYRVGYSPAQRAVLTKFYAAWADKLKPVDFSALGEEARADYVLLRNAIENEQALLARDAKVWADVGPLLPFADTIMALEDMRREMRPVDPRQSARALGGTSRRALDAIRARLGRRARRLSARDVRRASRPIAPQKCWCHSARRCRAGIVSTRDTIRSSAGGRSRRIVQPTHRSSRTRGCSGSASSASAAARTNRSSGFRSAATV